jgi:hypothetical protein
VLRDDGLGCTTEQGLRARSSNIAHGSAWKGGELDLCVQPSNTSESLWLYEADSEVPIVD